LFICVGVILIVFVVQSGISDSESHSNALKILLQMGEYFQIQVTTVRNICSFIVYEFHTHDHTDGNNFRIHKMILLLLLLLNRTISTVKA